MTLAKFSELNFNHLRSLSYFSYNWSPSKICFIFQDAAGSIWKVDLSFSLSMQKPSRIYRCHAQEVTTLTGYKVQKPFLYCSGVTINQSTGSTQKSSIYNKLLSITHKNLILYNTQFFQFFFSEGVNALLHPSSCAIALFRKLILDKIAIFQLQLHFFICVIIENYKFHQTKFTHYGAS